LDQRLCGDAVNLRLIRKAMSIVNPAMVCFAVQLLMAAALAIGEATGRLRLPYSKFGTGVGVPRICTVLRFAVMHMRDMLHNRLGC
jgi:hypothetical protein